MTVFPSGPSLSLWLPFFSCRRCGSVPKAVEVWFSGPKPSTRIAAFSPRRYLIPFLPPPCPTAHEQITRPEIVHFSIVFESSTPLSFCCIHTPTLFLILAVLLHNIRLLSLPCLSSFELWMDKGTISGALSLLPTGFELNGRHTIPLCSYFGTPRPIQQPRPSPLFPPTGPKRVSRRGIDLSERLTLFVFLHRSLYHLFSLLMRKSPSSVSLFR